MSNRALIIGALVIVISLLGLMRFYNGSGGLAGIANSGISAPDFSLERLGGGTISLAEYKGKKPVIIDFWASWCPNCKRDMPRLNRFYEKYKNEVEVIGINLQENTQIVQDFVTSRNISFPIALDPSARASRAFGVRYTNTHILIDKEGNIVREIPGDIRESDIVSLIQ